MDLMDYRRKIMANSPHLSSASGVAVSFSDGADLPLKSLNVDIEPVQSGSGDPSPTNIRPISGWNGVKVTRTGKNLFDASNCTTNTWNVWRIPNTLKPNTTYTYSINGSTTKAYALYLNESETSAQTTTRIASYTFSGQSKTFTTPSVMKEKWLLLGGNGAESSAIDVDNLLPQIELSSTATPYEPYNGMFVQSGLNLLALPFVYYTSVSTDLANYFLIKAGTYVFSFSTSTASYWRFIVRLKDLDGNVISDSQHNPSNTLTYRSALSGYTNGGNTTAKELVLNIAEDCYIRILHWMTANPQTDTFNDCKLEEGSIATEYQPYTGTIYGGTLNPLTGVLTAYPYYASYNGETLTGRWVSDRNKYVAGTTPTIGAQVVDMSGTGTEIQLTPHQIRSLYGNNTIFADTGNVALEYWAHP